VQAIGPAGENIGADAGVLTVLRLAGGVYPNTSNTTLQREKPTAS